MNKPNAPDNCQAETACVQRLVRRHRLVIESLQKNITRNTHCMAEELGMSVYHVTSLLHYMQRRGLIRKVCKGFPGKRGYPALWMMPPNSVVSQKLPAKD